MHSCFIMLQQRVLLWTDLIHQAETWSTTHQHLVKGIWKELVLISWFDVLLEPVYFQSESHKVFVALQESGLNQLKYA